MTTLADIAILANELDTATRLERSLVQCFLKVAESYKAGDPVPSDAPPADALLDGIVNSAMAAHGLSPSLPLNEVLDGIEPHYTAAIYEEARLLTESAEQSQRRIRLLLRSPRSVYGLSEIGDDEFFEPLKPVVDGEINRLQNLYVPHVQMASGNFLLATDTYESAPLNAAVARMIDGRRERVSQEAKKLRDGTSREFMSIGAEQAFYRGYTDMSHDPRADYTANTIDLCRTHIAIANTVLAKQGLRIAQMYMVLSSPYGRAGLNAAPDVKQGFDDRFTETANAFKRSSLHLEGGDVRGGQVYGARQYLDIARRLILA